MPGGGEYGAYGAGAALAAALDREAEPAGEGADVAAVVVADAVAAVDAED